MKLVVKALALAGTVAFMTVVPAHARDNTKSTARPAIYQAVVDCRTIGDSPQRLACFDRTVAEMASAAAANNLVILDREAVQETKKGLFGFNLPRLRLFGGADAGPEIVKIETKLVSVRDGRDGFPLFTFEGNGRWKQTSGRINIYHPGDKAEIRRGALGAYFASIGNWPSIKVTRLPE